MNDYIRGMAAMAAMCGIAYTAFLITSNSLSYDISRQCEAQGSIRLHIDGKEMFYYCGRKP